MLHGTDPNTPAVAYIVRVIARNLAVFSNVTLTKTLYGIRKSGHSLSCVFITNLKKKISEQPPRRR
jgi:hypothetical protein